MGIELVNSNLTIVNAESDQFNILNHTELIDIMGVFFPNETFDCNKDDYSLSINKTCLELDIFDNFTNCFTVTPIINNKIDINRRRMHQLFLDPFDSSVVSDTTSLPSDCSTDTIKPPYNYVHWEYKKYMHCNFRS